MFVILDVLFLMFYVAGNCKERQEVETYETLLISYLSVGSLMSELLIALLLKQQTLKLRDKVEIELDHVSLLFQPHSSIKSTTV